MTAIDPIHEAEAIADWKAGDILAGGRLLKMHAGLIHAVALRHVTDRCELDDLLQVCRMTLLAIVPEHNPALARLSTFAFRRMHRMAGRYARSGRYVVKVSVYAYERGVVGPSAVYLDAPIGDGDETIASRLMLPAEDTMAALDAETLVAALPARERDVMRRLYFGDVETQVEVAASSGYSKQRIGQIKTDAIARLRRMVAA